MAYSMQSPVSNVKETTMAERTGHRWQSERHAEPDGTPAEPERGYGEWSYHGPSTYRSPERWHGHVPPGFERSEGAWSAPRGSETRDPITGRQWAPSPRPLGDERRQWTLPPDERHLVGPIPEPPLRDFSGRGPKNYTRAEERIHEDVCDRLTSDPFVDATDIDVRVTGGEITLEGAVRTRDQKRRAEDITASVRGVRDVQNRVRITER
jgi:hypothetical protein